MTLIENVRSLHHSNDEMMQIGSENDSASLYRELQQHVTLLSLSPRDQELATSLVSVLSRLDRLAALSPELHLPTAAQELPNALDLEADVYASLSRGVSDFQSQRMDRTQSQSEKTYQPPIQAVETALLWNSIDSDFENVLRLCQQQRVTSTGEEYEHLPPGYEYDDADHIHINGDYESELPAYSYDEFKDLAGDSKAKHVHPRERERERERERRMSWGDATSEKMKLDLDSVAMAIERFYLVAPQLHNQRVELRKSKTVTTEPSSTSKGKEKEEGEGEMLDLLAKASSRRLNAQAFVVPITHEAKLQKARIADLVQRQKFVEHILDASGAGRMESQDALPPTPRERQKEKEKDPDEMISLPDFMREPPPLPISRTTSIGGSEQEDVEEDHVSPKEGKKRKVGRSRSLSAPGLGWFLSRERTKEKERTPSPKAALKNVKSAEVLHGVFVDCEKGC